MNKEFDLPAALKALSDETRLRMLALVLQQECCVCEVMQALDISQTRASRNLSILKDAGFLISHRESKWMHYSLSEDSEDRPVGLLVKVIRDFSEKNALCRLDKQRLKKAVRMGHPCISDKTIRK